MRIIRATHLGMCFGVRDAIALALASAEAGPLTILAMVLVIGSAVAIMRVPRTRIEKGNTHMLTLIGRIGFVVLVGMAALGVWRAYTYSPQTRIYAPFVLILLLVAVLMSVSLLARGRRS